MTRRPAGAESGEQAPPQVDGEQPLPVAPSGPGAVLMLVDVSGYIFRAFHALPPLSNSRGVPTNAVLGFTRMLLKLLRERQPSHVGLCFDREGRRGRLEIDPEYKANRTQTPAELVPQFDLVRRLAAALAMPALDVNGWEADDVIATMAARARSVGLPVEIVSSDKDLLQLVAEGVRVFDPVKETLYGPAEVLARFGLAPKRLRDYQALVGDASDNVPGVPGVGPKTAVALLERFGDLEGLLARASEIEKPKLRAAVEAHRERIRLNVSLVSFRDDLPVTAAPAALARRPPHAPELRALFEELDFHRLLAELPGIDAQSQSRLDEGSAASEAGAGASVEPAGGAGRPVPVIAEAAGLEALSAGIVKSGSVALVPVFQGEAHSARLEGLGVCVPGQAPAYLDAQALGREALRQGLSAWLGRDGLRVAASDGKALLHLLASEGLRSPTPAVDVELFAFLRSSAARDHRLESQVRARLGRTLPPPPVDPGAGAMAVAEWAGAAAAAVAELAPLLEADLRAGGLEDVARRIDLPLIPVLARMERAGVLVDRAALAAVSSEVDAACQILLTDVYRLAGHEFNVGSPPQLARVLFEELGLPVVKRGKTGPSTDHEVLEKLAAQHPLPKAIIEYRNVSKLKSTYLDTLPSAIDDDGRIRTTFHQTAAATGRLSSTNPNLQNIPVRTELGRRIRRAFVAPPGWVLVSADYSQIELRILAAVSRDEGLLRAFAEGADVHARTAAEIFGLQEQEVTDEQRRIAKMVNYGIAYGLSAHGLSVRLGLSLAEAQGIITRYFERFPRIRTYIDETIATARETGVVATVAGRRRDLPDLRSRNRALAMAAERAAVNMPIQGTASDVIKLAMLELDARLSRDGWLARMLLQVHDELVLEAPADEAERVGRLAREVMEAAGALDVRLEVNVGAGPTWADAH